MIGVFHYLGFKHLFEFRFMGLLFVFKFVVGIGLIAGVFDLFA